MRPFEPHSYALASALGSCFIYAVFLAFLSPDFITGLCQQFSEHDSDFIWALPSETRSCGAGALLRSSPPIVVGNGTA